MGIPRCLVVKNPFANAGDMGSIHGSEKSPGEENGKLLQYSCLGNPMDRGVWWATILGVKKSRTGLSDKATTTQSCSEDLMRSFTQLP